MIIHGGVKYWAVIFRGARGKGWWTVLFNFTVILNFNVKLSYLSIFIFWSWVSLCMSCRYCNKFNAQLYNLWFCSPNNGGAATKVFQCNRSCLLFVDFSLYLASRFIGNLGWIGVCEIRVKKGVEGSERVSGSDKYVSDETSIVSFIEFSSPWVKACAIQNGRCSVVAGGLKRLSLICLDVGGGGGWTWIFSGNVRCVLLYWSMWGTLNCTARNVYWVCCRWVSYAELNSAFLWISIWSWWISCLLFMNNYYDEQFVYWFRACFGFDFGVLLF